MEHLETMYYKKDSQKSNLKKKQTKRKKLVGSRPENFEIVIENAETSEVKYFNFDKHETVRNRNLNERKKNVYFGDDVFLGKVFDEGRVNEQDCDTKWYDEESEMNLNVDDFNKNVENPHNFSNIIHNSRINGVEHCFDNNGNEITNVKTELSELDQEDTVMFGGNMWEYNEKTNDHSKTKLTDLEKTESALWNIAAGYDFDAPIDGKLKFEPVSPPHVQDDSSISFDISNIKIKEESVRSIKEEEDIYDRRIFVNINCEPLHSDDLVHAVDNAAEKFKPCSFGIVNDHSLKDIYTFENNDVNSSVSQLPSSCKKLLSWGQNVEETAFEKSDRNNFKAQSAEHLTEKRNMPCSVDTSSGLRHDILFPNLASAIRKNTDKSQMDKKPTHTSYNVQMLTPEHDVVNRSDRTDKEEDAAETKTSDGKDTFKSKEHCVWRKINECPVFTDDERKAVTKVKFTLKKKHSVYSKYNALSNIDPNSEGDKCSSEKFFTREGKDDNDKQELSIASVHQLSAPHTGANKETRIEENNTKSDFTQKDKRRSWQLCYEKFALERSREMSDDLSIGNLVNEHGRNLVNSKLDNADHNDLDYNYVMLDGIMSLSLNGSGELDRNAANSQENDAFTNNISISKGLKSHSQADKIEASMKAGSLHTYTGNIENLHTRIDDNLEIGWEIKTEVARKVSDDTDDDIVKHNNYDIKKERTEVKKENFNSDTQGCFLDKSNKVVNVDESFISGFKDNVCLKEETLACIKTEDTKTAAKPAKRAEELFEDNKKVSNFKNIFSIISDYESKTVNKINLANGPKECTVQENAGDNKESTLKLHISLPKLWKNDTYQNKENSEDEPTGSYETDSDDDNITSSNNENDSEYEENNEQDICESYRIVQRYYIDRCTGKTLQKLLLRVKERKTYTDHELDDDEIEGKRSYKIEDKLTSDKYNKDYVKKLHGEEFNLRYLQENGLQYPILFAEKNGLGLRVPSDNFKVCDVKACVGSRRMLDVMDVNTQKGLEMTMKEWVKYYENTERDRLLNVISLEFSHTKLENYVESPNLVREVDWVDTAWPQHLKDCQTESTNAIDKMKYPKVQKYCLMSVAGCYTDFHIDFGGTSVWYHILHGEKIFWLIPPTDKNLAKYENWVLSGKQGDAFLADSIEECQMIQLVAGNTFIIPSGWIHAVFTPKDSLVFGGNFLHSFNMVNQLKVSSIEDKTHVPMKFRYPFYAEINWYVLERYVHSLTGVTYLEKPQLNEDLEVINTKVERDQANFELLEEKLNKRLSVSLTRIDDTSPGRKSTSDDDSTASGPTRSPGQASSLPRTGRKSSSESANSLDLKSVDKPEIMKVPYKSPVKKKTKYVHLTKYELEGLIEVLAWVESLPPSKKGIPKDLIDPDTVLREVRHLIQEHMKDNPELAITGEPVLEWTKATKKLIKLKQKAKTAKLLGTHCVPKVKAAGGKNAAGNRHRRVRCKKCEPCTRDDCMECNFCKDMRKYGGPGRAKQSCISRQCLAPILPKGIVCLICKMPQCLLDKPVKTDGAVDDDAEDYSSSLMECGICWEIVHPLCLRKKNENLNNDGVLNEDLPNSWKCSKCCFDGKEGKLMARVFKGGWRPTPASTPPPLSVSPPLQPQSPVGSPGVFVSEGKRVTLNQGIDSKKTMPKLSPSPEHREIDIKPLNGSTSSHTEDTLPSAEMLDDEKTHVKMEVTNTLPLKNEPAEENFKTYSKRSSSPLEENPMKKKRNISPSPSRASKSSRVSGMPKLSPGSGRKSAKTATPDLSSKRSKRETTPRSGTRCTYDFDDDEEFMDISAPLPDKGKGKGVKGRKNLHLKTKDFGANLASNVKNKSHTQTVEPKPEDRGHLTKKSSEKLCSEQLRQTLISHIEKRNLPIIKPQFVVRPAPISPPDDYCVMNNGQKHPLSRKLWTYIFSFLPCADLARCQAVCQIWNRWCINPDLWKKIDLSKKRIVQTHLMGIVRRQPEYLDLSAVIMTQKQILWLLERIPLLKTLIVSKCSWATISGLCMSACPLLYKLDVSWATGLNDRCFEDLISPPVDRKPAVKNISRLHRLKSVHLSGTEITDVSLELMTLHLAQLEELNISYCTRITDRGIQILASSKSPTQDSLKVLNISGCRGLTEVSLDAIKNFSKLKELFAMNCIRIPTERCRSLRHPRLKTFRF
ncbi:lysine-specific demethylase 2B-like isoform X2 [Mercenaria mercenaria]|uniref:lysine-specific demethylase 2B-like isoform X2 n=1 Tax=Mercenaria mercenaria TaxID=6596 RepID=UPI00234F3E72|nr:lysine-specific demethylase 2B-like isoform X2 [Mercenaria mercenaria]